MLDTGLGLQKFSRSSRFSKRKTNLSTFEQAGVYGDEFYEMNLDGWMDGTRDMIDSLYRGGYIIRTVLKEGGEE